MCLFGVVEPFQRALRYQVAAPQQPWLVWVEKGWCEAEHGCRGETPGLPGLLPRTAWLSQHPDSTLSPMVDQLSLLSFPSSNASSPSRRGGESGTGGIRHEQADGCRPSAGSANGACDG